MKKDKALDYYLEGIEAAYNPEQYKQRQVIKEIIEEEREKKERKNREYYAILAFGILLGVMLMGTLMFIFLTFLGGC